jgi:hypothetical protein
MVRVITVAVTWLVLWGALAVLALVGRRLVSIRVDGMKAEPLLAVTAAVALAVNVRAVAQEPRLLLVDIAATALVLVLVLVLVLWVRRVAGKTTSGRSAVLQAFRAFQALRILQAAAEGAGPRDRWRWRLRPRPRVTPAEVEPNVHDPKRER